MAGRGLWWLRGTGMRSRERTVMAGKEWDEKRGKTGVAGRDWVGR
jgi:hypothetical protein